MNKILCITLISVVLVAGCGKQQDKNEVQLKTESITTAESDTQSKVKAEPESEAVTDAEENNQEDTTKVEQTAKPIDYSKLYDTLYDDGTANQIKEWVQQIVASSTTIQEEIKEVDKLSAAYVALNEDHYTQADMNMISYRSELVWDAELNSLWSRMSDQLDADTKEKVLTDLRRWNANKEDVIINTIGPAEGGGSIYPLLYNELMESMIRKKIWALVEVYTKQLGQSIEKPICPMTGTYVDYQDTDEVYSYLMIKEGWESDLEAQISIYRLTTLDGTVTQEGDVLHYTDNERNLTGTITYGWDGATFVVDTSDFDYMKPGDSFQFDVVF